MHCLFKFEILIICMTVSGDPPWKVEIGVAQRTEMQWSAISLVGSAIPTIGTEFSRESAT